MTHALSALLLLALACNKDDPAGDSGLADDDLTLASGFDEAWVSGTAAADEELTTCPGWWPTSPQHLMTLESTFTDLGVIADTTEVALRIVYQDSEYCSDVVDELPAVVRGSWSAGTYEIYVGVPEGGAGGDYQLQVVEHYY